MLLWRLRYERPVKIYFLRHGIAADTQTWNGGDAGRPLTDEGCDRLAREAKTLAKLDLDVDLIVTSPLLRAKQTAEIVGGRLGLKKNIVEDARLAGGFDPERLAAILQDYPDAKGAMLVGHEPDFSTTVGRLVGDAQIDLKKGGVACVDLPDRAAMHGRLLWLVSPKILTI